MNRKNLTAAVLAGLAGAAGIVGTAQAVNINPDGLGQVLIYPYYTTNGGNQTLLSVVNTTGDAKAVKVRFTEGQNTREVLDFNLYLSMYDVWTAALYDDNGTPTMVTTDTTCTVPYIYGNGGVQAFLPYALTDGGSDDISRAAEGHFEMIEMGTIVDELTEILDMTDPDNPVSFDPPKFAPTYGSAAAATHVDGVPADCQQLVDAWTDPDSLTTGDEGYWLMDPLADLENPSGGLFGGAAVVDVVQGVMYSYDARALNGFAVTLRSPDLAPLHQLPGTVFPNLNSGDQLMGTVFMDDGTILGDTFTRGVDAVSYVFMHDTIMNGYTTEEDVAADTEWVVTFPTKHFYVYQDSSGVPDAVAPFTTTWDYTAEVPADGDDPAVPESLVLPCEVVLLDSLWDREERTFGAPDLPTGTPIPPIVSPAPPDPTPEIPDGIVPFELCYETSVIQFGAPQDGVDGGTPILGSMNSHLIDNTLLGFQYGWARLEMDDYPYDRNENGRIDTDLSNEDPDDGYTVPESELSRDPLGNLEGLPITGFAVERYTNDFVGGGAGVIANYGTIFGHRSTRKATSGT